MDYTQAADNYYNFYQRGGNYPVFRGLNEQYGHGLGDILGRVARGVWGFLRPAVSKAATTALSSASGALASGAPLREIAQKALGSAPEAGIQGVGTALGEKAVELADKAKKKIQGGSGKRRRGKMARRRKHFVGAGRRGKKRRQGGRGKKRRVYKKRRHTVPAVPGAQFNF